MKDCFDKTGLPITSLKRFYSPGQRKMDEAIVKAFYKLYSIPKAPEYIMPMNIQKMGNSSVRATIPRSRYGLQRHDSRSRSPQRRYRAVCISWRRHETSTPLPIEFNKDNFVVPAYIQVVTAVASHSCAPYHYSATR